jgi:hypothetical protein
MLEYDSGVRRMRAQGPQPIPPPGTPSVPPPDPSRPPPITEPPPPIPIPRPEPPPQPIDDPPAAASLTVDRVVDAATLTEV